MGIREDLNNLKQEIYNEFDNMVCVVDKSTVLDNRDSTFESLSNLLKEYKELVTFLREKKCKSLEERQHLKLLEKNWKDLTEFIDNVYMAPIKWAIDVKFSNYYLSKVYDLDKKKEPLIKGENKC